MKSTGDRTVLVTDTGRGSAIAIVRSLGRMGLRVIAADADPNSLGFHSRYAHETLVYPDPRHAPHEFVQVLSDAVRDRSVDLLVPVTDEAIHPLAHERDRFEADCRLAIGPARALEIVTDKSRTLELARSLGISTPATRVVRGPLDLREARAIGDVLGWPLVLKPAVSRKYVPERSRIVAQSVRYARDPDEVVEAMNAFETDSTVLLQEYCHGAGHGIGILAREGATLAAFQHHRLAEIPITGGASAWRESVPPDPTLLEASTRMVEALGWTGLMMVEFKSAETPLLMEINGRVWGSLPLAVRSGMDFPRRMAELYLEDAPISDPAPTTDYETDVRAFNLDLIASWVAQVLRGRPRYPYLPCPARSAVVPVLLGLLDPRQGSDIVSLSDPIPGLAQLPRILRKLGRKLRESARSTEEG